MKRLLLLLLLLLPTAALPFGSLRGHDPIYLMIEDLDPDAEKCGVTKERLKRAVEFPLSRSRIRISEATTSMFYVHAIVKQATREDCVVFLLVQFRVAATDTVNCSLVTGLKWEKQAMGIFRRDATMRALSEVSEQLTKTFINEWTKDNPK